MPALLRKKRYKRISKYAAPRERFSRRKYHVNAEFFQQLGPEQAYWAGYLAADGCVTVRLRRKKDYQFVMSVVSKDKDQLEKLRASLDATYPIHVADRGRYCLMITSYGLCLSLEDWGIIPRKSHRLMPPNLPPTLYVHWCRGLVDGDGWFNLAKARPRSRKHNGIGRPAKPLEQLHRLFGLSVVGSFPVCSWLTRFGGGCYRKASVFTWRVSGSLAKELVAWMYADPDWPAMTRKRNRAIALGLVRA